MNAAHIFSPEILHAKTIEINCLSGGQASTKNECLLRLVKWIFLCKYILEKATKDVAKWTNERLRDLAVHWDGCFY